MISLFPLLLYLHLLLSEVLHQVLAKMFPRECFFGFIFFLFYWEGTSVCINTSSILLNKAHVLIERFCSHSCTYLDTVHTARIKTHQKTRRRMSSSSLVPAGVDWMTKAPRPAVHYGNYWLWTRYWSTRLPGSNNPLYINWTIEQRRLLAEPRPTILNKLYTFTVTC